MKANETQERYSSRILLLIFAILAAGIICAGYYYFRNYAQRYRAEVERNLSAIAEMKVGELTQWRKERMGDASIFLKNVSFSALTRRFIEKPEDAETSRELQSWLANLQSAYQYESVLLVDAQGVIRLSAPDGAQMTIPHLAPDIAAVRRSEQIAFLDFHRDKPESPIHLSILVPIFDMLDMHAKAEGRRFLGVIVLRIDPARYLYPLVNRWPTSSKTAETLLIRKEGNDALYLNELRFRKNTALNLRTPLEHIDTPAVQAALDQRGIMEGKDYRGVPVVAYTCAIPDSPWRMVARMDTSEVHAPVKERLALMIFLVLILTSGAGAGIFTIWRQQNLRFYRERYKSAEALRESEEQLSLVLEGSQLGFWDWNIATNQVRRNARWAGMLGYTLEEIEFTVKQWTDLQHSDDQAAAFQSIQDHLEGRTPMHKIEYRMRAKNGQYRWILDQAKVVTRDSQGKPIRMTGTHTDITERKHSEEALRESEERFRSIFEHASVGKTLTAPDGALLKANQAFANMLGYTIEELEHLNFASITHPDDIAESKELIHGLLESEGVSFRLEKRYIRSDGRFVWADVSSTLHRDAHGRPLYFITTIVDITERKRNERVLGLTSKIYQIANRAGSLKELLEGCVEEFKAFSGCEAVGFRLLDAQGNIPYQAYCGFPKAFYEKETPLNVKSDECMCIYVIKETINPSLPVATPNGSFYCNGTSKFLATIPEEEKGRTRNICNKMGYESVALIPIRTAAGMLGLVQLNDHQENKVPLERVQILEEVVPALGETIRRLQVEDSLKQSEHRLRTTLDSMMEGGQILGNDWRYVYINDAAETQNRRPKKDLLGRTYMEMWPGVEAAEVFAVLRRCMEERMAQHMENEFSFPDGSIGWFDLSIQPVPEGLFILSVDISERKHAEKALRESEARLRAILDATPFPIAIVDVQDSKIDFWSRSALTLFGHTAPTSAEWYQIAYPNTDYRREVIDRWKPFLEKAQQSGQAVNTGEYQVTCRDGSIRLCELHAAFLADCLIVTFNDVTERKRAEAALKALSSRQEALLSAVPDIIMEVDNGKVYTWANAEGLEFFGEDAIGKEAAYFFEGEQETYLKVKPLFNGHHDLIYVESWQRRKDGQKRLLAWQCRVLKDESGQVTGALSSARDITEIKQAEDEIRQLNTQLEKRVADRTAQLEMSNKELEAFAYSVSHDLRAPLRAVDGFSRIIVEDYGDKLDDEGKRILNVICTNTQRMDQLIADLLELSRASRAQIQSLPIDMAAMAQAVYEEVASPLVRARFAFSIAPLPEALGDPVLMRQVWRNLLANAIKFTSPSETRRIEVGGRAEKDKNVYFVKDTGVGFDPRYAHKLFGVFQRLHKSSEFDGTGIGLAIVQRIVLRHNGRVRAEGNVNEGAAFYFELPVNQEEIGKRQ